MGPLGMLGVALGTPLLYIGKVFGLLAAGEEALERMLSTPAFKVRNNKLLRASRTVRG